MSDIAHIHVGSETYSIKDQTARQNAEITYASVILIKDNWSNATYSFEAQYSSNTYDILDVVLNSGLAERDQRDAWINADCAGHEATNIIRAHGTVPTVNIPVVLLLKHK